ncbi:Putative signal transduction protein involved in RNA splicing [Phaffia rhodozyma]|uniref:Putative signal transduction protein involved in RNA splicing n=1 Tax=Phaffia rhodozyma TaxID=264483 RepID=A0A0F7SM86_PHARH|nr:Putative signal transduction protein involved in RNA splicing [Phaffia rhodozyma]
MSDVEKERIKKEKAKESSSRQREKYSDQVHPVPSSVSSDNKLAFTLGIFDGLHHLFRSIPSKTMTASSGASQRVSHLVPAQNGRGAGQPATSSGGSQQRPTFGTGQNMQLPNGRPGPPIFYPSHSYNGPNNGGKSSRSNNWTSYPEQHHPPPMSSFGAPSFAYGIPPGSPYQAFGGYYASSLPASPLPMPPHRHGLQQQRLPSPSPSMASQSSVHSTTPSTYAPYYPNVSHNYYPPPIPPRGFNGPPSSSSYGGVSQPASPNSSQASTIYGPSPSPQTIQGPDGQTWMYFPVMPSVGGYYEAHSLKHSPGSAPYSSPLNTVTASTQASSATRTISPYVSQQSPYGYPNPTAYPGPPGYSPVNISPVYSQPPPPPSISSGQQVVGSAPARPGKQVIGSSASPAQQPHPRRHPRLKEISRTLERKAWHPVSAATRSEFVMWVGNMPSDATEEELWRFFTTPLPNSLEGSSPSPDSNVVRPQSPSLTVTDTSTPPSRQHPVVSSIFPIARSNCCFINYYDEPTLLQAVAFFNNQPIRPAEGARSPRLVCRIRNKEDQLKAGVGGQRGRGVHTGWVKSKWAKGEEAGTDIQTMTTTIPVASYHEEDKNQPEGPRVDEVKEGQAPDWEPHRPEKGLSTASLRTMSSQASTDSSFLARYFPVRYFILKSLTSTDLDTSTEKGLWATQPHNEQVLDQAFRTSKDVFLIFGANQTGEFYGYARMAGPINKETTRVSWASRGSIGSAHSTSSSGPGSVNVHPHHQRSAPDRIAETAEEEANDTQTVGRAATAPHKPLGGKRSGNRPGHSKLTPSMKAAGMKLPSQILPDVSTSPAELTPGEEKKYASGRLDIPPFRSSTLSQEAYREPVFHQSSAPAELEQASSPAHVPIADPSEVFRPLTKVETNAIIEEVAKAGCSRVSPDTSPSRSPDHLRSSSLSRDKPHLHLDETSPNINPDGDDNSEDENGIKRKDQLESVVPSSSEGVSSGSAPSVFTGSSLDTSSSRLTGGFYFPNLHLPPSPNILSATSPKAVNPETGTAVDSKDEKSPKDTGVGTWGTPFKIEWIQTKRLPFQRIRHLRNPWNSDREIKVSRDGTEVEPDVGRLLLQAWTNNPTSPSHISPDVHAYTRSPPHVEYSSQGLRSGLGSSGWNSLGLRQFENVGLGLSELDQASR